MRPHQIERSQIADPLVQCCRTLEIGEQKRQRRDLEALVDIEIVGLVEIAKRLIGENPFGSHDRLALAEQIVKRVARNPDRGQHAIAGIIFESET